MTLTPPWHSSYSYPLLIIDPNTPSEHTLLQTPHKAQIIHHSWTPLYNLNMLLTADSDSTVCIWEQTKSNCANDYCCIHQLQIENVVAIKWIYNEKHVRKNKFFFVQLSNML